MKNLKTENDRELALERLVTQKIENDYEEFSSKSRLKKMLHGAILFFILTSLIYLIKHLT